VLVATLIVIAALSGAFVSGRFLTMPSAQAQQSTEVKDGQRQGSSPARWRYLVYPVTHKEVSGIDQKLNALGRDGWELVGVNSLDGGASGVYFFKQSY
jgi:hypothetical protein